ncbi:DUF1016 N-terminal domain-containing protein [Clostridium sp. DJ247]|uniref:DUF1016 N-terminal domain-containing protein n=1 Tax=Clostridium sp. DJ247 TaxID=2726188 RepID=UPI0028BF54BC|nr:DUF1016 N-terminal domain-containing protein [Clostridium sp. DJ247]
MVNAINKSKNKVATAVNSEMVILYWNIGRITKTKILKTARAEYGKSVTKKLSKELTREYGKGYFKEAQIAISIMDEAIIK